jgi:hypothetical protein
MERSAAASSSVNGASSSSIVVNPNNAIIGIESDAQHPARALVTWMASSRS